MSKGASDQEVAAVVAALTRVLKQETDPLRDWRLRRRQALRMQRNA
jgi:hypothetical protein